MHGCINTTLLNQLIQTFKSDGVKRKTSGAVKQKEKRVRAEDSKLGELMDALKKTNHT